MKQEVLDALNAADYELGRQKSQSWNMTERNRIAGIQAKIEDARVALDSLEEPAEETPAE